MFKLLVVTFCAKLAAGRLLRISEDNAAPAEPVPLDPRSVRGSDGGKVCVDLDIWKMRSESSDALPGDQLTVVSEKPESHTVTRIIV